MSGNKILRILTTAIIALGAAYGSFDHIVALVEAHGQHGLKAFAYPLMVDALMILCSVTLTSRAVNRPTRFWTRLGMVFGLACSLLANLLSSNMTDTVSAVIAVVPAIVLLITVEILLSSVKGVHAGRRRAARTSPNVTPIRKSA